MKLNYNFKPNAAKNAQLFCRLDALLGGKEETFEMNDNKRVPGWSVIDFIKKNASEKCDLCGSEIRIRHTHGYCSVAGALAPNAPNPEETWCNIEHDDGEPCSIIACTDRDCENYLGIGIAA